MSSHRRGSDLSVSQGPAVGRGAGSRRGSDMSVRLGGDSSRGTGGSSGRPGGLSGSVGAQNRSGRMASLLDEEMKSLVLQVRGERDGGERGRRGTSYQGRGYWEDCRWLSLTCGACGISGRATSLLPGPDLSPSMLQSAPLLHCPDEPEVCPGECADTGNSVTHLATV